MSIIMSIMAMHRSIICSMSGVSEAPSASGVAASIMPMESAAGVASGTGVSVWATKGPAVRASIARPIRAAPRAALPREMVIIGSYSSF